MIVTTYIKMFLGISCVYIHTFVYLLEIMNEAIPIPVSSHECPIRGAGGGGGGQMSKHYSVSVHLIDMGHS